MRPPQYHLKQIRAFYRESLALEVDELTIASGCLHLLTGPNGSGKSTLLASWLF